MKNSDLESIIAIASAFIAAAAIIVAINLKFGRVKSPADETAKTKAETCKKGSRRASRAVSRRASVFYNCAVILV